MKNVQKNLTLDQYQALVKKLSLKRGFTDESVSEKFMLILEEAGEFAKAARRSVGMRTGEHSKKFELEEEAPRLLATA